MLLTIQSDLRYSVSFKQEDKKSKEDEDRIYRLESALKDDIFKNSIGEVFSGIQICLNGRYITYLS